MDFIIVGAGGMGREVFSWLSQEIEGEKDVRIRGFIDDNLEALDDLKYPVKIIARIKEFVPKDNERLVLGILNPKIKRKVVEALLDKGGEFYTLIHPTAVIGTNVHVGKGVVICPNCIVTNDVKVGDFVFINTSSTVGHDTVIGDFTSINGKVEITGNVIVGKECLFGVGAKVIPKRQIGDRAIIGAGSVVIKNIPSNMTVFGNPAKNIRV